MPGAMRLVRSTVAPVPFAQSIYHALRPGTLDEMAMARPYLPAMGTMVDVGAHHGGTLEPFARDGWRVIAVEPDPTNRAALVRRSGSRPNVTIDPRAIGERDGDHLTLYTSDVSTGISTLTPFHPSHRPTVEVETVRLDTLLADVDEVTLLKTDTEGWDLPVLRTFPWDRLRPKVVVCEFEDRKTIPLGYTYHDLARFLVQRGYTVQVSEWYPVVQYGRTHRWRRIVPYPVELNPRAWGNLIGKRRTLMTKEPGARRLVDFVISRLKSKVGLAVKLLRAQGILNGLRIALDLERKQDPSALWTTGGRTGCRVMTRYSTT